MAKNKKIALAGAVALTLALAGCGQGDGTEMTEDERYTVCLEAGGSWHSDYGVYSCEVPPGEDSVEGF